jgi:hypothetical protein
MKARGVTGHDVVTLGLGHALELLGDELLRVWVDGVGPARGSRAASLHRS